MERQTKGDLNRAIELAKGFTPEIGRDLGSVQLSIHGVDPVSFPIKPDKIETYDRITDDPFYVATFVFGAVEVRAFTNTKP